MDTKGYLTLEEKKFLKDGVVFRPIKLAQGMRQDVLDSKIIFIKNKEFAKLESFNKQFLNDQKLNQKNKRPGEREAKEDEVEQKTQRGAALKKMLTMKMKNDVDKEINLEEEFKSKANQDK